MAPEPGQDPFEPTKHELETARRLLGPTQAPARRLLRTLLGEPATIPNLKTRFANTEPPLDPETVETAIRILEREDLTHRTPADEREASDTIHASRHGVRVALAIQTLQPVSERMQLVDKLQAGRRSVDDDLSRTWYVLPEEGRSWRVERGNASRASGRFDTKEEAIEQARAWAKEKRGGQVVVHRKDGSFQRRIQEG